MKPLSHIPAFNKRIQSASRIDLGRDFGISEQARYVQALMCDSLPCSSTRAHLAFGLRPVNSKKCNQELGIIIYGMLRRRFSSNACCDMRRTVVSIQQCIAMHTCAASAICDTALYVKGTYCIASPISSTVAVQSYCLGILYSTNALGSVLFCAGSQY